MKPKFDRSPTTPKQSRRRLRTIQREFLEQCMNGSQTLAEVMEDYQLTPRRIAEWTEQPWFRERLAEMVRAMRQLCNLEVAIGATRAASMLGRGVNNTLGPNAKLQRQACVDMIRLARELAAHRKADWHRETPDGRPDPASLAFPDLPTESRDDLLEALQAEMDAADAERHPER